MEQRFFVNRNMGISIDLWRLRIGSFCQKIHHLNKNSGSTGCVYTTVSSCIIALLLLCAGIEPNPGPTVTVAELSRKLEEFISTYNVTREQIQLSIPALAIRLDDDIKNMRTLITAIEDNLKQLNSRMAAIETHVHVSVPASSMAIVGFPPVPTSTMTNVGFPPVINKVATATQSIENIVQSVLEKEKRKFNLIIYNLTDNNSFFDDRRKLDALLRDLHFQGNFIQCIDRIGRYDRDRPLRITLSSIWHRERLLESAKQLASLQAKWPKLSISPDRTSEEMKLHKLLMSELNRRRALGENIRLCGESIVPVTKVNNNSYINPGSSSTSLCINLPPIGTSSHSLNVATSSLPSDTLVKVPVNISPLRVNLPPIGLTSHSLNAAASSFQPSDTIVKLPVTMSTSQSDAIH